jgi:FAD/FMN-containing dehydrogenase
MEQLGTTAVVFIDGDTRILLGLPKVLPHRVHLCVVVGYDGPRDAAVRRLDEQVLDAGGRLYFAKDSRAKARYIPQMYPRLDEWRAVRAKADPNGVFMSDLARRLELVPVFRTAHSV